MILPTGGGKTSVFCKLAVQTSHPVLILVHRRELATQAANRLREFGVEFGYILSGERPTPYARVQIASVQTLIKRKAPRAGLVICDEAHLSTAATWSTILEQYPNSKILGVTATPWRLAGKPLVGAYDAGVIVSTPAELRAQGFLSPYVGFSYLAPDLSGVKSTGGDFNEKQSGAAMRAPAIVANIVEQWQAHASHLSTVVFAVTVEHSRELTAQFLAVGVRAEHLDGSTPVDQRRAILARVDRGETQVLCNVGVAVEGLDIPRLKCCVLARPTMSLARAIQMMGRVRRPWRDPISGLWVTARIHDHAFVIRAHGLPDADRDYTLSAEIVKDAAPPSLTTCSGCAAVYTETRCPNCEQVNAPVIRTGPEMLDDAEQFEFSSDDPHRVMRGDADDLPAEKVIRPPVEVSWNAVGKVVEGIYRGAREQPATQCFGCKRTPLEKCKCPNRVFFDVEGPKRSYSLPSTSHLAQLMRSVSIPDSVRITYTGDVSLSGGRSKKLFRVEVDDGKPDAAQALYEGMAP